MDDGGVKRGNHKINDMDTAMDSNQLGISSASTGKAGAIQPENAKSESQSPSGFARLFSMIQNKAEALSHSTAEKRGESRPEFGKDLPLKYAGSRAASHADSKEKPETAVLSISGERSAIGSEETLVDGLIAPLTDKIELDGKNTLQGAQKMPEIQLPQLDQTAEKIIPEAFTTAANAQLSIAPANVITSNSETVPSIAATGKIIPLSQGVAETPAPAPLIQNETNLKPENLLTPAIESKAKSLDSPKNASIPLSQATFNSLQLPAASNPTADSVVTVKSEITEEPAVLSGITGLNKDLGLGQYSTGNENLSKQNEKISLNTPSAQPQMVTNTSPQVALTQLEIDNESIKLQMINEKSLVDASFQRQLTEAKPAEVRAAEVKQLNLSMSDQGLQPRPEVKPEGMIDNGASKAAQNRSFEEMWDKANSIENFINRSRMEQLLGSRPVSELSRSVHDAIQPVSTIDLPLSTKPSLATQPLFSVSGNTTSMPSPGLNFRQGGWENSLAQNVSWMTGNNIKTLQVNITPAELGPIHIHASMDQDKLSLQINAQNGVTRETLEAAIPRLRELLGESSFSAVNVDVSSGGRDQNQFTQNDNIKEFDESTETELTDLDGQQLSNQNQPASKLGLVDTFA